MIGIDLAKLLYAVHSSLGQADLNFQDLSRHIIKLSSVFILFHRKCNFIF